MNGRSTHVWRVAVLGVALGYLEPGTAADPVQPASSPRATPGELVEWVVPAAAPAAPQSESEKERGREHGRALPTPELLQPALDPALPVYQLRTDLELSGAYTGASSDVLPSLVQRWLERFSAYYPKVTVRVAPPYAGSLGAQELVKENLDFVFVSRELKPEDIASFREKFGYDPLSVPICAGSYRHYGFLDAVAFVVHKDNPLARISFEQIDAIFSSTRHRSGPAITTWGQLGLKDDDWANQPIHPYGIKPWNGFEEFVRQRVLSSGGKRGEWRSDVHLDPVVFPIAARVAADRYAIGYTGLAYVDAGVRVLALQPQESGTAYAPTYENVARADYPLSRLIYFNTNSAPGRPLDPAIAELLRFILSREGQEIVREHQIFLPLRENQAAVSRALLDRAPGAKLTQ